MPPFKKIFGKHSKSGPGKRKGQGFQHAHSTVLGAQHHKAQTVLQLMSGIWGREIPGRYQTSKDRADELNPLMKTVLLNQGTVDHLKALLDPTTSAADRQAAEQALVAASVTVMPNKDQLQALQEAVNRGGDTALLQQQDPGAFQWYGAYVAELVAHRRYQNERIEAEASGADYQPVDRQIEDKDQDVLQYGDTSFANAL